MRTKLGLAILLLGSIGIGILGGIEWGTAFYVELAAGVAVFLAGIPLAFLFLQADHRAQEASETAQRRNELEALSRAGRREAERVGDVAEGIDAFVSGRDRPVGPLITIVPVWAEALGPRYLQLTGNDDPLHSLRQAHARLAKAVMHLEASESPSPPYDPKRLQAEAGMEARAARRWASEAEDEFKVASPGW